MSDAIVVEGLVKRFGATTALDGVHLTVAEGSVLGLLGPNGAGKTTVVRILTTLLRADAGRVRVAGLDVVDDADAVRASIGLTGQYAPVDQYLTGHAAEDGAAEDEDRTGAGGRTPVAAGEGAA